LAAAQQAIASNWITFGQQLGTAAPSSPPAGSSPPTSESAPTPACTLTASYNSRYNDFDVYVHSNQPDQTVIVATTGVSASWHTDSTGYADVYLHASRAAVGQRVTATVGGGSCSGTLG